MTRRRTWTNEELLAESRKYSGLGRGAFSKGSASAYTLSCRRGLISSMPWLGEKCHRWTDSELLALSREYAGKTVREFKEGNHRAFRVSENRGLLPRMTWLVKERRHRSDSEVLEESRKYTGQGRGAFRKGSPGVYDVARKRGLLSVMTWLGGRPKVTDRIYFVYKYTFPDGMTYVGLTMQLHVRRVQHTEPGSPVFEYARLTGFRVPSMEIIGSGMTQGEAVTEEGRVVQLYASSNKSLNKGRTGEGSGSVGAAVKKWTRSRIVAVSRRFGRVTDFQKRFPGAYNAARRYKIIHELFPKRIKWTDEYLVSCASQCLSRSDFKMKHGRAYDVARINGLLPKLFPTTLRRNGLKNLQSQVPFAVGAVK